jgi:DNA-binding SARP family transcriptional activator
VDGVQIYTLGQFRLVVDDQVRGAEAWRRKRARQLLKCLLSQPHHRLLKARAVELFWPDTEPEAADSSLRSLVFGVRQVIDRDGTGRRLSSEGASLALQPGPDVWIDADEFEDALATARAAVDPIPLLEHAVALYRGDFLPDDLFEDWSVDRRDALRHLWTQAKVELGELYERRGEMECALNHLHDLVLADRTNELAAQRLMRLYLRLNRPSDVFRVGQELTRALLSELGVEPGDDTLALLRQASRRDSPTAVGAAGGPVFRCAYPFPEPRELVGREQVLGRLQRSLERARSSGQTLLISAPAGTGKSALVGSLVRQAQAAGTLCLAGGCYDERSGVPLAAFQEALTDYVLATATSRDVGESTTDDLAEAVATLRQQLGITRANEPRAASERTRLFAAVRAFVLAAARRGPVLVCVEDIHAADPATLDLVQYLAHETRQAPVALLATLRLDQSRTSDALAQLLSALGRQRLAEHVRLGPLDRTETARLVGLLVQPPHSEALQDSVYAATQGNPLLVEQFALALPNESWLDEPTPPADTSLERPILPRLIRQVVERRLAELTPGARETVQTAAVLGVSFDYLTLLQIVQPVDEVTLLAYLSEAVDKYLLRETPGGYAFTHSLLREGVYWALSRPRRMLLHRRVSEALERLVDSGVTVPIAELEYHLGLGGRVENPGNEISLGPAPLSQG